MEEDVQKCGKESSFVLITENNADIENNFCSGILCPSCKRKVKKKKNLKYLLYLNKKIEKNGVYDNPFYFILLFFLFLLIFLSFYQSCLSCSILRDNHSDLSLNRRGTPADRRIRDVFKVFSTPTWLRIGWQRSKNLRESFP